MKNTSLATFTLLMTSLFCGSAMAKLPPPSDEAKAKAAETKNKSAWTDKTAAYQLCMAQDKIAARYLKEKGKAKPTITVPDCQNPGAYVALHANTSTVGVADSKPVPEAGAKK